MVKVVKKQVEVLFLFGGHFVWIVFPARDLHLEGRAFYPVALQLRRWDDPVWLLASRRLGGVVHVQFACVLVVLGTARRIDSGSVGRKLVLVYGGQQTLLVLFDVQQVLLVRVVTGTVPRNLGTSVVHRLLLCLLGVHLDTVRGDLLDVFSEVLFVSENGFGRSADRLLLTALILLGGCCLAEVEGGF
jgi:hypothetical protein